MTKISSLAVLAATLILGATSCGGTKTEKEEAKAYTGKYELIQSTDSVVVDSSKAVVNIKVDYPTCKCATAETIRTWIGRQLTYNYSDNSKPAFTVAEATLSNIPEMVKLTSDSLLAASARSFAANTEFAENYEYYYTVDTVYEAPTYVTYQFNSYCYIGGAHGGSLVAPATFSTADGTVLTWDNTIEAGSQNAVIELIRQGLASQFFTPESGWTIDNGLLIKPSELKLPTTAPSFTDKGLCVLYQQYEIAPYAVGMPACNLSYESITPYLTPQAKTILGLK